MRLRSAWRSLMETQLFPEGTDEVQLTVQLDSADFEISDQKRPLRIPRAGRSRGEGTRFRYFRDTTGPQLSRQQFTRTGNFVQQMELTFDVGVTLEARPSRSPHGDAHLRSQPGSSIRVMSGCRCRPPPVEDILRGVGCRVRTRPVADPAGLSR